MDAILQGGRAIGKTNTFQNLQKLKETQAQTKVLLGNKYESTVVSFIKIIQTVMKANDKDVLESMLMIKDTADLYKQEGAPLLFASAVIEIVEETYFEGFSK
jgi:hypothetical protein